MACTRWERDSAIHLSWMGTSLTDRMEKWKLRKKI